MRTGRGLLSLGSATAALAWKAGDPLKFREAFCPITTANPLARHPARARALAEAIAATHAERWPGVVFRLFEEGSALHVEVCDRRTLATRVEGNAMLASEIRLRSVPRGHVLALAQSDAGVQLWTFDPTALLRLLRAGELPPPPAPPAPPPRALPPIRSRYTNRKKA